MNVAAPDLEIYGSTNMESEDASIICYSNPSKLLGKLKETIKAIVTQPMLQRRPNRTELRSMDSYIQISYRFHKSKQKGPPPSLPCTKKQDEKKEFIFSTG